MIDALARQRKVETIVADMTRRQLDADLKDLCQIVYLHLLEMDEDKLRDLYDTGDIQFYLIRVINLQLYGHRTTYEREVLRFRRHSISFDDAIAATPRTHKGVKEPDMERDKALDTISRF